MWKPLLEPRCKSRRRWINGIATEKSQWADCNSQLESFTVESTSGSMHVIAVTLCPNIAHVPVAERNFEHIADGIAADATVRQQERSAMRTAERILQIVCKPPVSLVLVLSLEQRVLQRPSVFLVPPTWDGHMKALAEKGIFSTSQAAALPTQHFDLTAQDGEGFAGRAETRTVTCSATRAAVPHTTRPGCHISHCPARRREWQLDKNAAFLGVEAHRDFDPQLGDVWSTASSLAKRAFTPCSSRTDTRRNGQPEAEVRTLQRRTRTLLLNLFEQKMAPPPKSRRPKNGRRRNHS